LSGGRALEFKFVVIDHLPESSKQVPVCRHRGAFNVLEATFDQLSSTQEIEKSRPGRYPSAILKSLGTPKTEWQEIAKNISITSLNFKTIETA
jgi:hypothetical protein